MNKSVIICSLSTIVLHSCDQLIQKKNTISQGITLSKIAKYIFFQLIFNNSLENIHHIYPSKHRAICKKTTALYRQQCKKGRKKLKNVDFKAKNLLAFPTRPHVSRGCWLFLSFAKG
jgi:hypothetical protein